MSGMFSPAQDSSPGRRAAVTVTMFAILLASVGAAAWVVYGRQTLVERGAALVSRVRQETLDKHWAQDQTRWRLIEDAGGNPIGWSVTRRWRTDADFSGVRHLRVENQFCEEEWTLSPDAATGTYTGSVHELGVNVSVPRERTSIDLQDGRVAVRHTALTRGGFVEAEAEAPDNYIPEGMTSLMVELAASEGRPAAFKTIFNNEAIVEGRVRFASVTVVPQDRKTVRFEVNALTFRGKEVFHFDEKGELVRIDNLTEHTRSLLVTPEKLLKAFPRDDQLRELYAKYAPRKPTTHKRRGLFA
jgi:hypothetical protein